jgi:hypothetical protein
MWFAALSSYPHQPWLVHLAAKLLTTTAAPNDADDDDGGGRNDDGSRLGSPCPAVLALVDGSKYPFNASTGPPAAVRASLYAYDFTRLDTPWARHQPNPVTVPTPPWLARVLSVAATLATAPLAPATPTATAAAAVAEGSSGRGGTGGGGTGSGGGGDGSDGDGSVAVWTRKRVGAYLPAVSLGDPSLDAFLAHHGFPPATRGCARPELRRGAPAAEAEAEACAAAPPAGNETAAGWAVRAGLCPALVAAVARARWLKHRPGREWRAAAAAMALLVLLRAWDISRRTSHAQGGSSGEQRARPN